MSYALCAFFVVRQDETPIRNTGLTKSGASSSLDGRSTLMLICARYVTSNE